MKVGSRPLTLAQLLRIAERGYRRGGLTLANYVNLRTGAFLRNPPVGDTLAEFVAIELAETFDPGTNRLAQLNEAVRVMGRASEDLHLITDALIHARNRAYSDQRQSRRKRARHPR